jgi:hypothetical protein
LCHVLSSNCAMNLLGNRVWACLLGVWWDTNQGRKNKAKSWACIYIDVASVIWSHYSARYIWSLSYYCPSITHWNMTWQWLTYLKGRFKESLVHYWEKPRKPRGMDIRKDLLCESGRDQMLFSYSNKREFTIEDIKTTLSCVIVGILCTSG